MARSGNVIHGPAGRGQPPGSPRPAIRFTYQRKSARPVTRGAGWPKRRPRRSRAAPGRRPEAAPRSRGVAADALATGTPPAGRRPARRGDRGRRRRRPRAPTAIRSAATGRSSPACRSTGSSPRPTSATSPKPTSPGSPPRSTSWAATSIPIVAVRTEDGRYWTPERQPPPGRAPRARRPVGRRHRGARDRGGAPDPAAQHREGAQPPGARARGDPPGPEPRRAGRPSGEGVRERVRGAGAAHPRALLPGERTLRRRRLPPGAQADREVPRRGAAQGAGGPAGARRPGAGAGRGGDRGGGGAQGEGLREPLPSGVRRRPDQPAPLQAGRQGGVRRDDRQDARRRAAVRLRPGSGRIRSRGPGARRRSRPSTVEAGA